MPRGENLAVCLCLEDFDNCDILLGQLGSGHVFGPSQHVSLLLQGTDKSQLEALCWDIQDCIFPLITGMSTCSTFNSAAQAPDIVMVLLADRSVSNAGYERNKGFLKDTGSSSSPNNCNSHFSEMLGLVEYTSRLAEMLKDQALSNSHIVVLGDSAHIAASLLSSQLNTMLQAGQIIALDAAEDGPRTAQTRPGQGQMSKVTRFCHGLRQWWTGEQSDPKRKAILGTKFVSTKQPGQQGEATGYFFSAPVDLSGSMTFSAHPDVGVDVSRVEKVKTATDMAHSLAKRMDGSYSNTSSIFHIAHL